MPPLASLFPWSPWRALHARLLEQPFSASEAQLMARGRAEGRLTIIPLIKRGQIKSGFVQKKISWSLRMT